MESGLVLFHLDDLDGAQHIHGCDSKETSAILTATDHCIKRIVDYLQDKGDYHLMIVSDHGQAPVHTMLRPSLLLQEVGVLQQDPAIFPIVAGGVFAVYISNDKATPHQLQQLEKLKSQWKGEDGLLIEWC